MSIILFTDNATSLLASGITNSQTTLVVTATQGALFPAPGAGQIAVVTLEDTGGNIEVVWCTGRTSDTLTIVRAQEGTAAAAFASGSRVELRCTAGILQALLQKNGGDTMTGTTNLGGVLALGSGGSIQGGEYAGGFLRSAAGVTTGQIFVSAGVPMSGSSVILTNTSLAANLPSGTDLAHTNMIVFWAGTSLSIPAGWHLCDGTSGTPDLRDLFIVGGGGALPTSGNYIAPTGAHFVTEPTVAIPALTTANLPRHTHGSTIYGGNAGQVVGPTGTPAGGNFFFGGVGAGVAINWLSDTGTGLSATPTAPTGTLADATGHSHAQQIPYRAVFAIMKL